MQDRLGGDLVKRKGEVSLEIGNSSWKLTSSLFHRHTKKRRVLINQIWAILFSRFIFSEKKKMLNNKYTFYYFYMIYILKKKVILEKFYFKIEDCIRFSIFFFWFAQFLTNYEYCRLRRFFLTFCSCSHYLRKHSISILIHSYHLQILYN